ncbi:hypothetical protein T440DRAFT_467811 [Plenodomus tracheiphilus IPT5]|uniref:Uncharacterized protein n=1 Tax=Plenodomus tracheiphilus IPT5 TaxID=1408161 RepID=A0A6A7BAX9_9PLEO|nr:hypothetical protein T440DRAFT_467811 [Plenodomus tracheiphilus IPT5]
MWFPKHVVILATLPALSLGMKRRSTTDSFNLFAYGSSFGGLPLFYANGYAYIGEPNEANSTDAAVVSFTANGNGVWTGAPNATNVTATAPSWSNVTIYVPATGSDDTRIGFLSENDTATSDELVSGFRLYGSTATLIGGDGNLETLWYSLQVSKRVHALYWNDTTSGQAPVILRNKPASNPPN